jgi:anti-sigma-K factor RskA
MTVSELAGTSIWDSMFVLISIVAVVAFVISLMFGGMRR